MSETTMEQSHGVLSIVEHVPYEPSAIQVLPDEMIKEILSRLPVKSLLKFMCVSKSWCSMIIGEHYFIKSHHKNLAKNVAHHARLLVFPDPLPLDCMTNNLFVLLSFRSWIYDKNYQLDFTFINNNRDNLEIVGTCNGLCCIRKLANRFLLWNPATKKSHQMPCLDMLVDEQITTGGFGYDEANNDYKVLTTVTSLYDQTAHQGVKNVMNLYSLSTNSWKKVDFLKDVTVRGDLGPAKFVNGNLHWCTTTHKDSLALDVSFFDLGSEVHGLVELPDYVVPLTSKSLKSIGVLDGRLSCMLGCVKCPSLQCKEGVEVWVMKEYGSKESWNLLARMKVNFHGYSRFRCEPFCMGLRGEIICWIGDGFIVYDPKTKSKRHVTWCTGWKNARAHLYVESLVSPFPLD